MNSRMNEDHEFFFYRVDSSGNPVGKDPDEYSASKDKERQERKDKELQRKDRLLIIHYTKPRKLINHVRGRRARNERLTKRLNSTRARVTGGAQAVGRLRGARFHGGGCLRPRV